MVARRILMDDGCGRDEIRVIGGKLRSTLTAKYEVFYGSVRICIVSMDSPTTTGDVVGIGLGVLLGDPTVRRTIAVGDTAVV